MSLGNAVLLFICVLLCGYLLYALLKADIQNVQREDSRTWRDVAAGFRQAWRGLRESLDQAVRESH